jgi:hypothetical protein
MINERMNTIDKMVALSTLFHAWNAVHSHQDALKRWGRGGGEHLCALEAPCTPNHSREVAPGLLLRERLVLALICIEVRPENLLATLRHCAWQSPGAEHGDGECED